VKNHVKKKLGAFKPLIKALSTALGLGFYLVVTSTLLVAWFSPHYIAKIQLAPIDLVLHEPFAILALAPVMIYGTISIIREEVLK